MKDMGVSDRKGKAVKGDGCLSLYVQIKDQPAQQSGSPHEVHRQVDDFSDLEKDYADKEVTFPDGRQQQKQEF
jgi:hypothetical protein